MYIIKWTNEISSSINAMCNISYSKLSPLDYANVASNYNIYI